MNKAMILLVEDDASIRKTFSYFLDKNGYDVTTACDGLDAIDKLKDSKFDVLITDLLMPRMGGIELLSRIHEQGHRVACIVVTADDTLQTAVEAMKLGAYDYITKPFKYKEALFPIERTIEKRKLEFKYHGLLKALSRIIDLRDGYTNEHSQKVAYYSVRIGERLGLARTQLDEIHHGALLHDVGKLGVKDSILNKSTDLTESEYDDIRQHANSGKEIMSDLTFLGDALHIIQYHHEHYDGNGYPVGLKEKKIPIGARIVAVADAYHAMTSNRPYRKSLEKEEAIRILKKESGSQFDPVIVKALVSFLQEDT